MSLGSQEIEGRETASWCAGLPRADERQLRADERAELARWAWRLCMSAVATLVISWVGGVLLWRYVMFSAINQPWAAPVAVGATLFLLVAPPFILFDRGGSMRRGIALFRDLRKGFVVEFTGIVIDPFSGVDDPDAENGPRPDDFDATQRTLLTWGFLQSGSKRPQTVSILPVSLRVWRVNGKVVRPWITAEAVSSAN